jgi:hypothetical protein
VASAAYLSPNSASARQARVLSFSAIIDSARNSRLSAARAPFGSFW